MSDNHTLRQLLIDDVPLIDVRAPVEFSKGAFPCSINLPILDDDEREQIGICYKDHGPDAAVALGHTFVSGDVRSRRLQSWRSFVLEHPDTWLYCFRGGQRSGIACEWLASEKLDVPRVSGGYKALRNVALAEFDELPDIVIVSGKTGTGKTDYLRFFDNAIDLEGLASHRGSAFGGRVTEQPTQVSFENALAVQLLKHKSDTELLLEDEGRLIGRVHLPVQLQEAMKKAPTLVLEESLETRSSRIYQEYIVDQWAEYQTAYGEAAIDRFSDYLLNAADAIRKRLGGELHQRIRRQMSAALDSLKNNNSLEGHIAWIGTLLADYYDPMYDYQFTNKKRRVMFSGTLVECRDWYKEHQGSCQT